MPRERHIVIAFPAWRRGFLKVTGSVIDEALRRHHTVWLLRDATDKPGESVERSELAYHWPDAGTVMRSLIGAVKPDACIGDPSISEMNLPGKVYALDFCWENLVRPAVGTTVCWPTRWMNPHGPVTGMTALDPIVTMPTPERGEYGLDDRPVVLLFSLKFSVPHLWRKTVYRHLHYPKLLSAIRTYCDAIGAQLIVKTREKNGDPPLIHHLADRVIGDRDLWPYTSARLVRLADLVIHFSSGAVYEAVTAGVPQLSIDIPMPYLHKLPGHHDTFAPVPYSIRNWTGLVQSATTDEAIKLLRDGKIYRSIDPRSRAIYATNFTGNLDGKSACRVLDLVEHD